MAQSIDWVGTNKSLGPPSGMDEMNCHTLRVFANGQVCVSCWEPSPEELAEIVRSGQIFLSVFMGPTQPPVFVGSETAVHALVADSGAVWKLYKEQPQPPPPMLCIECGVNPMDFPSTLCPGCQAYKDHTT